MLKCHKYFIFTYTNIISTLISSHPYCEPNILVKKKKKNSLWHNTSLLCCAKQSQFCKKKQKKNTTNCDPPNIYTPDHLDAARWTRTGLIYSNILVYSICQTSGFNLKACFLFKIQNNTSAILHSILI